MESEIRRMVEGMAVGQSGEPSPGTDEVASRIRRTGKKALPVLVDIGEQVCRNIQEWGSVPAPQRSPDRFQDNARMTRSLLFVLAKFCEPRVFRKPLIFAEPRAIDILCKLADRGAGNEADAKRLLKTIAVSEAEILARCLLSLPLVQASRHARPMELGAAMQHVETRRRELENPYGHVVGNCYCVGHSYTHAHEVFRVGSRVFESRVRELK